MANKGAFGQAERIANEAVRRRVKGATANNAGEVIASGPAGDIFRVGSFGNDNWEVQYRPTPSGLWVPAVSVDKSTGAVSFSSGGQVRYDTAQALTAPQQTQARSNIYAAPRDQSGLRNVAGRNGGFEVWQRGAGAASSIAIAASSVVWTADGWYLATGANQAFTVTAQAGLTNGSRLCARVQRNSGQTGTGTVRFAYPLTTDEVAKLRGGTLLKSFVVSTGANWSPASGTLTYNVYLGTGAQAKRNGVGYTGETNPISGSVNLSTSAVATPVVSTLSAAVGTNFTQGEIQFSWTPTGTAGANDWLSIDDVDTRATVDLGAGVAPVFERVSFEQCLPECLKHFWKSFPYDVAPAQNVSPGGAGAAGAIIQPIVQASASVRFTVPHPVEMVRAPSVLFYNPNAANDQARAWDQSADCTSTGVLGTTGGNNTKNTSVVFNSPASSAGYSAAFHMTADAGIV